MRLPSATSAQSLDLAVPDLSRGEPRARWSVSATMAQRLVAASIVPMVAVTAWLALASEHLEWPVASAVYRSCLTAATVGTGLYWWVRRPASRFGPLLVALGILTWVISWEFSDWPLPFDVGVLAEGPTFVLIVYLFLAFPMGRLEPPAARWLIAALGLAVVAFFVPWALFSPVIAGAAPLTSCAPKCPANVLQIGSAPTLVEVTGKAETYASLAITAAVFVVYALRVRGASRPQRRALMAVAVTSLLYLPAFFASSFAAWVLHLGPAALNALAWVVVGARILMPLGFLIALLQAERFAASASRNLLERLVARPAPERWREIIAGTLDDSSLRLGYYDPTMRRFRNADGSELTRPTAGSGRRWVGVDRDGAAVAAMVIDETLTEDPELVRAAASATLLAVENGALEGELRASRARVMEAGDVERRRIERDLHDSAQQRLVALRIHMALTKEKLDRSDEQAMLDELGVEVDEAIDELRGLARGVYPQVLAQSGVDAALADVARRSTNPISVRNAGLGRHPEAIEMTVYYCCLECIQNAAKHAGPDVAVTIRLSEDHGYVRFCITDDGAGFDPAAVEHGAGLTNLADRVAAVGGTLHIDAAPGRGTRVTGVLPT